MFKTKKYGKAYLVGINDFQPLIEYTVSYRTDYSGSAEYPVVLFNGKDLVTGTKLIGIEPEYCEIETAIKYKGVKRNTLYISGVHELSKVEFLEELSQITENHNKLIDYMDRINNIKISYHVVNNQLKDMQDNTPLLDNDIKMERSKVKKMVRKINKENQL